MSKPPEEFYARFPYAAALRDIAEALPKFPDTDEIATEDIADFVVACVIPLMTLDSKVREAMGKTMNMAEVLKRVEEVKQAMFTREFGGRLKEDT